MYLLVEEGFRQNLRWQTDVIEAYDGTEQRVKLASLPRASYHGAIHLEDDDLAAHRALLADDASAAFELPQPFEAVASVNAITGTTVTIVPTYTDWAAAGRSVYIRRPDGTAYTTVIDAVGGGGATLTVHDSPPAGTWPAGLTQVMPVESVLLEEGQVFSRWPVVAGRWELQARQATARALGTTGAPAMTTLGGLDVLDRRPLASDRIQEQVLAGVTFLDAGGAVASSAQWATAKPRRTFTWSISGATFALKTAERQWWKQFLGARYGRLKTFRLPTWRPDLELNTFTAGSDKVRVNNAHANYLTRWWPSLAHRAIQVPMTDGTFQRRTVTAAADVGGGVTELTVNAVMTGSPSDVVQFASGKRGISLLETARLDSDEVSIEWTAAGGRISLAMAVVQA